MFPQTSQRVQSQSDGRACCKCHGGVGARQMKKVVGNIYNGLTMGERSKAINDGALFERAKNCEFERALL